MKTFYLEKSLGMDIREDSVSLTLVGKNLFRADVLAAEFIPIQNLDTGDEKAEQLFMERVNGFLIENKAWVENVVLSLPRANITLQSFELPAPDRKSVDSMMEFELERHFSSGMDSFYYSNHVTGMKDNQYHIVCAAVKKDAADRYLELIRKLNLKPTTLDVSTFANLNLVWLNGEEKESLSAVVDMSLNSIDISILNNRVLEFSRNVPINDPEYRRAFLNAGLPPEHLENLTQGVTQIVVEEIQNALASCRNVDDSMSVEAIHLIGGGPLAPYLADGLEKATEVPTHRVVPPEFVNPSTPSGFSPAFMTTSLGLSLRELKRSAVETNLLPDGMKATRRKKVNIKTTCALAAAMALFVAGFIVNQIVYNNKILASLNLQLEEIKVEVGPLEKIDLEYETLQKYMNTLNRIDQIHPTKLPMLIELSRILPQDTWLKRIQFKKGKMEIKGVSATASRLVPMVEASNLFRDARFIGTIITESAGEKFTISSALGATP
ncbi:hypothetical protein UZ36_07855 [Candidatus Nitromaritima sp. SCGC AAA799-C22]|nr:hypothetical protein UZ36_07855 [Candidatus Nitromaritima sp. SCGC AAA799-C22]